MTKRPVLLAGQATAPPTRATKLDALNVALRAAERRFFDLNLGVQGSVLMRSEPVLNPAGEASGIEHETWLTWGKLKGKWCLYVAAGPEGFPEKWTETALEQAPAADRKHAARVLPQLLTEVSSNVHRELSEIDEATALALAFARGEPPLNDEQRAYASELERDAEAQREAQELAELEEHAARVIAEGRETQRQMAQRVAQRYGDSLPKQGAPRMPGNRTEVIVRRKGE